MEDFSTILWVVVAIAAAVVSQGRKTRARSARKTETDASETERPATPAPHPTPSGWPAWPQMSGVPDLSTAQKAEPQNSGRLEVKREKADRQNTRRKVAETAREATPQTGTSQDPGAYKAGGSRSSGPIRPTEKAQTHVLKATESSHPHKVKQDHGQKEPSAAEIAADFDLRRAVIYSEILKPKFDE